MKKKGICQAAALFLAFGLCLVRPLTGSAVEGGQGTFRLDLENNKCSLTVEAVQPGASQEWEEDVEKADLAVDLYRVAEAVKMPGADSNRSQSEGSYEANPNSRLSGPDTYFYKLDEFYEKAGLSLPKEFGESEWEELAREAALLALDPQHPDTPVKTGKPGEELGDLSGGLYLIVARGESMTDPVVFREEEGQPASVATLARSPLNTYTFKPQIVSLPMKDPTADSTTSTADPGPWIYNVTAYLKPEAENRYGSLEIVKTLRTYETKEPGIFVFQIEAVLGGQTVYSDVESLIFTEAGQQTIRIENKFPAGATVTVTEIYEGGTYEVQSAKEQTVQIVAEDFVRAEFVNDHTEDRKGGHGIINQFDYTGTGEHDGWDWKSDPVQKAE